MNKVVKRGSLLNNGKFWVLHWFFMGDLKNISGLKWCLKWAIIENKCSVLKMSSLCEQSKQTRVPTLSGDLKAFSSVQVHGRCYRENSVLLVSRKWHIWTQEGRYKLFFCLILRTQGLFVYIDASVFLLVGEGRQRSIKYVLLRVESQVIPLEYVLFLFLWAFDLLPL